VRTSLWALGWNVNVSKFFLNLLLALLLLPVLPRPAARRESDPNYIAVSRWIDSSSFGKMNERQRELLIAIARASPSTSAPVAFCWKEGTDPKIISAFDGALRQHYAPSYAFSDGDRWSATSTNGPGLHPGDPTTLTWGLLPEGMVTEPIDWWPLPAETNHVVRMMDILFGPGPGGDDLTQRPWFPLLQQVFDRWSEFTGIRYVYEPHDDQAPFPSSPGSLGVRPDIRICAVPIDGEFGGVLGFNDFPDNGDMVLDYDDRANFGSTQNNSRFLRNVIAHEHGHGLGLWHVCPIEHTKLMEAMVTTAFDGPQLDDILGANRGYGDHQEFPVSNDGVPVSTDLGSLVPADTIQVDTMSVDGRSDRDYYKFTVPPTMRATITLSPLGYRYYSAEPSGGGDCIYLEYFDAKRQSNLAFQLLGPDGNKVLASADYMPIGLDESIENFLLREGPGSYFVHVFGDTDKVQLYDLSISVSGGEPPVALCKNVKSCQPTIDLMRFNNGSYDPDGDAISFSFFPEGPFLPGETQIRMIVSDGYNADTCQASVMVNRPPVASARDIALSSDGASNCQAPVVPDSLDNGSSDPDSDALSFALIPTGPFGPGTHEVLFVATDRCGASDSALAAVTVTCNVPVQLLKFTAIRDGGGIRVSWSIADLEDNEGFHVDRQEPGGARNRITDQLLSGRSDYEYLDRQAPASAVSYFLEEWNRTGQVSWHGPVLVEAEGMPERPRLKQINPNPCRGQATITYEIPEPGMVTLEIFDVRGRKVRTLKQAEEETGRHAAIWDGCWDNGLPAAPGIYLVRFGAKGGPSAHKLIVIR
jgi:flagellar hook capping protein FlgD/matrixin